MGFNGRYMNSRRVIEACDAYQDYQRAKRMNKFCKLFVIIIITIWALAWALMLAKTANEWDLLDWPFEYDPNSSIEKVVP